MSGIRLEICSEIGLSAESRLKKWIYLSVLQVSSCKEPNPIKALITNLGMSKQTNQVVSRHGK